MKLRRLAGYGPAFVLAITLLALWQLYVDIGHISPRYLPAPAAIIQALVNNWGVIYDNTVQTLLEADTGVDHVRRSFDGLMKCSPGRVF